MTELNNGRSLCHNCGGAGWTQESGHACDGTEESCLANCPVGIQAMCEMCEGAGYYLDRSNE